ncbi:hypothetical protein [Xanthomonas oryzae]|uniref:hypothetical protein n=1 Tax=Xanthomonas oryzae TaxID=347 RepID=UPI0006AC5264|nr:hypothetical protein [Xanthomonas oryzae]UNE62478.1 hypothetical protein MML47_20220 [Xanthomonas oryzae]
MRKQKAGATDLNTRSAANTAACGSGVLMLLLRLRCIECQARFAVVAAHAVLKTKTAARHA